MPMTEKSFNIGSRREARVPATPVMTIFGFDLSITDQFFGSEDEDGALAACGLFCGGAAAAGGVVGEGAGNVCGDLVPVFAGAGGAK